MFRKLSFILCLASLLLAGCQTAGFEEAGGDGEMTVELSGSWATKAGTDATTGETAISDTQIFLFNAGDGTLYRKETLRSNGTTLVVKKIKAGEYDVVAVSNLITLLGEEAGSLNPVSREELDAVTVSLGMCDPEKGFVMYGCTPGVKVVRNSGPDASSSGSTTKATVVLQRFAARVRLVEVKNDIPDTFGNLIVDYVFLENGYGKWDLGGSLDAAGHAVVSEKVNWAGRVEGHSMDQWYDSPDPRIDSEDDVMYPAQTFRKSGFSIQKGLTEKLGYNFYTLPNPAEDINDQADGPASLSQHAYLRIVVHATFANYPVKNFYYPVTVLGGRDVNIAVSRNTTYDVSMTIRGDGVDDPNQEIRHGNIDVSVSVAAWDDGGTIEKNY